MAGPEALDTARLHGILGDFVRLLDPHTEADPAAVYATALTAVGNLIGPAPFVQIGAARHGTNIFTLVVGDTSKARKGTSYTEVERLIRQTDRSWVPNCVVSGLASGEALIALVAGRTEGGSDRVDPLARSDPRVFVVEEEWSRTLAVARREGSILSQVIRQAWDGRPLENRTKRDPMVARDHHISIVGHITADEFAARGRDLDTANGFLNRHLIAHAGRSKLLPSGGSLRDEDLAELAAQLCAVVASSRTVGRVERTADAEERWVELYETMASDDPGGLVGAATARAEPMVMRLALIFCLLDGETAIGVRHLDAAWNLWRYCRASAEHLFSKSKGSTLAARLSALLEQSPAGLTRTSLHSALSGHVSGSDLNDALDLLMDAGHVIVDVQPTGGRPRRVYRLVPSSGGSGGPRGSEP